MYVCICVYVYMYGSDGGLVTKSYLTLVTPWTIVRQAPLPMGFSRQEYWRGLPFPSPGNLPYPGIDPRSPALQAESLPTSYKGSPYIRVYIYILILQMRKLSSRSQV